MVIFSVPQEKNKLRRQPRFLFFILVDRGLLYPYLIKYANSLLAYNSKIYMTTLRAQLVKCIHTFASPSILKCKTFTFQTKYAMYRIKPGQTLPFPKLLHQVGRLFLKPLFCRTIPTANLDFLLLSILSVVLVSVPLC